jgi:hypothetical protein
MVEKKPSTQWSAARIKRTETAEMSRLPYYLNGAQRAANEHSDGSH